MLGRERVVFLDVLGSVAMVGTGRRIGNDASAQRAPGAAGNLGLVGRVDGPVTWGRHPREIPGGRVVLLIHLLNVEETFGQLMVKVLGNLRLG